MPGIRFVALALAGLNVAGCASNPGPKEVGGTAIGEVAGGLIGNVIGAELAIASPGGSISAPHLMTRTSGALTRHRCRRRKPAPRARRSPGATRTPGATAIPCPGPSTRSTAPVPAIYAHRLCRPTAADRARDRLPQSRRHPDDRKLIVGPSRRGQGLRSGLDPRTAKTRHMPLNLRDFA